MTEKTGTTLFDAKELTRFHLMHVCTRAASVEAARSLGTRLGMLIPLNPNTFSSGPGDIRVIWNGPGSWLVHTPERNWRADGFSLGAAVDVSDSRRLFRLSGAGLVDWLKRYSPVNLGSGGLMPGHSARTIMEDIPVLMCRCEDRVFEIYVERSYGEAFRALLGTGH